MFRLKYLVRLAAIGLLGFAGFSHAERCESDVTFEALGVLAEQQAVLLLDVGASGYRSGAVKSLLFRHLDSNELLEVQLCDGLQALLVKPGTYKPIQFKTAGRFGDKTRSINALKGLDQIRVVPKHVNYIGNWTVRYKQLTTIAGNSVVVDRDSVAIRFNVDAVEKFAGANTWVKDFDLNIAHGNGSVLSFRWPELGETVVATLD